MVPDSKSTIGALHPPPLSIPPPMSIPPRVHPPPPPVGGVTSWFQKKCNTVMLHRIA